MCPVWTNVSFSAILFLEGIPNIINLVLADFLKNEQIKLLLVVDKIVSIDSPVFVVSKTKKMNDNLTFKK